MIFLYLNLFEIKFKSKGKYMLCFLWLGMLFMLCVLYKFWDGELEVGMIDLNLFFIGVGEMIVENVFEYEWIIKMFVDLNIIMV